MIEKKNTIKYKLECMYKRKIEKTQVVAGFLSFLPSSSPKSGRSSLNRCLSFSYLFSRLTPLLLFFILVFIFSKSPQGLGYDFWAEKIIKNSGFNVLGFGATAPKHGAMAPRFSC